MPTHLSSVLPDYPATRWDDVADSAPRPVLSGDLTGRPAGRVPGVVRVLTAGGVALGLAALPYKLFELDRFFVPKEVVLGIVAAAALLAAVRLRPEPGHSTQATGAREAAQGFRPAPLDAALIAFLVLSAVSGAVAPSVWLAVRAVALSAGGVALFWAARAAGRAGWALAVLRAAAGLVAIAVVTALLQAYGIDTEYFSLNRAPGGTFGNRNFVAHLCAIGLPLLAYLALRARTAADALFAFTALAVTAATLVLTRSRAAWLATALSAVPLAVGVARAALARRAAAAPRGHTPSRDAVRLRRSALIVVAAALGAVGAIHLPNALDWRSDSPYLDSARGMVNYREGSGQGRLKQWRNSARLVAAHPVLGVGPGHWSAYYPSVAPASDPSLTSERTTANPWPSSDWVAFAAERGLLGTVALGVAMLLLAWRAHLLVWHAQSADARLRGGVLGAVLAATLAAGAFDAVLLLAAPAFLAWSALGALAGAADRQDGAGHTTLRRAPALALVALLLAGAGIGTAHAVAMTLFSTGQARPIARAATLAPGDYRIQLRAAQLARTSGGCTAARPAATRAHTLAPSAPAADRVFRGCGGARPR